MPPEPLSWDRKDFVFRDRRPHDRGPVDALGRAGAPGSFSASRWREPPPFRGGGARDFRAPSPTRPLPGGHYKQPSLSKEPAAHPCPPLPPDDDNFRCHSGRYGSGSTSGGPGSSSGGGREGARREGRGHFQRSPPLNSADTHRRHHDPPLAACPQRSVTVPPKTPPASTSSPSPSPLLPLKDHHDDKPAPPVADGPATGGSTTTVSDKDRDQDHSLGPIAWKPLKWTRSGSFSSSTSVASRSEQDDNGAAAEGSSQQHTGAENPSRPHQLASPTPSDEGRARKKQRLGWGQGLAKYEKQKVEGPEESCSGRNNLAHLTTAPLNMNPTPSDTSPKLASLPGYASPTTPSSINCSSSKGVDDRFCLRTSSVDVAGNLSDSPCHESQCFSSNDFSLDLERLNADSLILMSSMLAYVLQPEDTCSGDSKFTTQTAVNKLAVLKTDILKALEKTEAEIDNIENDLKPSTSQQDEQSKCQSEEEDVTSYPVTDINPTTSSSGLMNDFILQSAPSSTESVQNHTSLKQCNEGNQHDIVVNNDAITGKIETGVEPTCLSNNSDLKTHLSSAPSDDNDILLVQRLPSCSEDGYMCKLIPHITSRNTRIAANTSNMLNKDLPTTSSSQPQWSSVATALHVKKKILNRKHSLRAKQLALTFKFRLLQHIWREDIHSLFIKKQRSKSQKRTEFGFRPALNDFQKPRTSQLRLSPKAGSLTLVPTKEMVDLASGLLSEQGNKMYTKYSSMPCLILDENERSSELASNKNGLVEDPVSVEKEKALINPWTDEEKKMFLENLAIHGKDFKKVASFLDHKTTADCIEFYYKNHKSVSFESVKKILHLRKQERVEHSLLSNDYMVETGKKWKREVTASSLDILGAASAIVSPSTFNARVRPKVPVHAGQYVSKTSSDPKAGAKSTESPGEATAANVLAGICSAITSEGISCVTSSVDPGEKVEYPVFSEVTQSIDEETCSDEGFGELGSGDWTDDEKALFIQALGIYKRDFGRISLYLGTRSKQQCKIFFSKARKCLGLDVLSQGGGNGGTPSSDANCGKSDLEDACLAEMDSAECSIHSKMDIDLAGSMDKVTNHGTTTQAVIVVHDSVHGKKSNEVFDVGPIKEEIESGAEIEQSLITFRNNDLNLSTKNEAASNEKIPEADGLPNAAVEGKSSPERVEELKANHTDLIRQVEPVSSVSLITDVPVKHEIIDLQHEDSRRNSFDNGGQVKSEPENLTEAVKVGLPSVGGSAINSAGLDCDGSVALSGKNDVCSSIDFQHEDAGRNPFDNGGAQVKSEPENVTVAVKVGLPRLGVSAINSAGLDCNESVAFSGKNDVCSSIDMLAPCVENRIELNLPTLPSKNTEEMVASQKQLSASTLPVNLLSLVTAFPLLSFESQPVGPLVNLNCEVNNDTSCTSCDKDVGEKSNFVVRKQLTDAADQSPSILSGFSLQSFNGEKMIGDGGLFGPKSVDLDDMQKKSRDGIHKPLFRKEIGGSDKSRGNLSTYNLQPSIQCLPADAQLRSCSQHGPCSEASVRTGDVKLFGKILSHLSSVPKPEEPEVKPSTSTSISTPANDPKHLSFELTSSRNNSRVLNQTNMDTSTHFGLAEEPLRSYGFWDGQRIRTGFSSFPENTVLLSKYPEVLSGMATYYQNKDSISHASTGNNRFVIHQQQPFSGEGKGQNGITEMLTQRNDIEGTPGFQQPGRVAMIVGGNMLVGDGASTGISNPEAALQMHYFRQNELLGGVSSNTEDDSWKGDCSR